MIHPRAALRGLARLCRIRLACEKDPRQMEEKRRGKANRIDAVQHASVTRDEPAPILDPAVSFDSGEHQSTEESRQRNNERHPGSLKDREWRHPPQTGSESGRASHASQESF